MAKPAEEAEGDGPEAAAAVHKAEPEPEPEPENDDAPSDDEGEPQRTPPSTPQRTSSGDRTRSPAGTPRSVAKHHPSWRTQQKWSGGSPLERKVRARSGFSSPGPQLDDARSSWE